MHSRSRGLSLVELMIAGLLGLLVIGAAARLFLQGAQAAREDRQLAQLDDELRFALAQLGQDLEMAGFWGEAGDPANTRIAAGALPSPDCGAVSVPALAIDTLGDATAAQAHAAFPCITTAEFHAGLQGTDIVVVKRVVPRAVPIAGHTYLATDGARSVLYLHADAAPLAGSHSLYEYRPAIWYLRRWTASAAEPVLLPALCRKVLVEAGPRMQSDPGGCVAQGIEDLQLEFGLDVDHNGIADRYAAFTARPEAAVLAQVVSVRVQLVARAAEPDPRYRHPGVGDHYRRRARSAVFALRNPSRLRAPPGVP